MKRRSSLLVAALAAFALPVLAQTSTPNIDQRLENQQRRIDQGVKSGELTSREAARLEKGEAHIREMEAKAKADGKVTPRERARLQKAENRQSRRIYREKHDRQRDRDHDGKVDRPGRK